MTLPNDANRFSPQRQTLRFLQNALAFVAALAWNAAFQELFERSDRLQQAGQWAYAAAVTAVAIAGMWVLTRVFNNGHEL